MGIKAEEAFFVRCDHTTMTQDDIDNGRLICIIGIAPVKPAEFVIFRITQFTGGSEIEKLHAKLPKLGSDQGRTPGTKA